MRIVHLARDEKFVPLLRALFETAFPGANRWVIARRSRAKLQFVARERDVTDRAEWWFRTPWVGRDVEGADLVVAHSMTTIFANAICRAPAAARVAWLGWGYDYYPLLEGQLGPSLLSGTRALLRGGGGGEAPPSRRRLALHDIAARLNVFCVLPTEEPLLRRALPALTARHHELPLFTAEDVFERGADAMDGPDVLVGNSATPPNNHVEAFQMLQASGFAGRVIAPLSYGNAGYGDAVTALGTRLFGQRFDPLRQWMPLDDYNRRIGRCGFVVMNHRRQQAVGNTGAALFKGATVYLRPENPMFAFYRGLGLHLRSTDELAAPSGSLQAISPAQRAENRARIGAHYARQRVLQAIRELPAVAGI